MNVGRAACVTESETARVKLADDSLAAFEMLMKQRRDLADGRWSTLTEQVNAYRKRLIELGKHPTGGSVLESLLGAVKYPFPRVTGERVRQKAEILSSALQQRQTKMLFVDRAEHLLLQRTMSREGLQNPVRGA